MRELPSKAGLCSEVIKIETSKQVSTISDDILICKISAGENNGVKSKRTLGILNYSV